MSKLDEIVAKLEILSEDSLEIVEDALRDATNRYAPTVLAAAKVAVQEVASFVIPGTTKKELAFSQVKENLVSQGISVGIEVAVSMIYKLIETAYRWFVKEILGMIPGAPVTHGPFGTN